MMHAPFIVLAASVFDLRGPEFLGFYALMVMAAVMVLFFVRARFTDQREEPLPPLPEEIDGRELAWLRGETAELVRLTGLDLLQRGYVASRSRMLACVPNPPPKRYLPKPAQQMLEVLKDAPNARELIRRTSLVFAEEARGFEERAQAEGFLHTERTRESVKLAAGGLMLGLVVLALIKILVALSRGHFNVGFLFMLMLLACYVLFRVSRVPRLSPRGEAYLRQAQDALNDLRYRAAKLAQAHDPLLILAAGAFGLSVLDTTPLVTYREYYGTPPLSAGNSSSGSSCGSGCSSTSSSSSSCSSSSGGSSCSSGCGGGCGGGGCGGCGS